ncbi:MAG: ABC transporter permease [Prevotella sp.]|nr:ABC transporter permease [Prevotella sp.]
MIQLTDISWWGVALMVVLLGAALAVYVVTDRRLVSRAVKVLGIASAQLFVVAAYVWGLFKLNSTWAILLWLVSAVVFAAVWMVGQLRLSLRKLLLPVVMALLVGVGLMSGLLLLCLRADALPSGRVLLPVAAVLLCQLAGSVQRGLQTYVGSLSHTREHYQYLLASGATHFEAVMPSVRRALRAAALAQLRPLLAGVPLLPSLLFCGLLLGGTGPVVAAIVVLLLVLASFSASVGAMIIVLLLADRTLFDQQRQFSL